MDTVTQEPSVSKLLCLTDKVGEADHAYRRARNGKDAELERRSYGRLHKAIGHLQETAEHFRKSGQGQL
jgi:hypothetical protein